MQAKNARTAQRRSNQQRSEEMRAKLIACGRALFVEKGFADTGTPEIVKMAQVTRGALYHHFKDKQDLFRAVVEQEAKAIAEEIGSDTSAADRPLKAMVDGSQAYFRAMAVPGRARLLLIEGPAILGWEAIHALDRHTGRAELKIGIEHAIDRGVLPRISSEAMSDMLSAAFDRAALAIENDPGAAEDYRAAMEFLLGRLFAEA